ncbi:MAG: zinc-finger domain-containing protein, partial [Stellaceae bacterium]
MSIMQPFEVIYVPTEVVACDGDGGVEGHPRVYLNLSAEGKIECPYC